MPKKITRKMPEFLMNLDTSTPERFQESADIDMFVLYRTHHTVHFHYRNKKLLWEPGGYDGFADERILSLVWDSRQDNFISELIYFEDDGTCWNTKLTAEFASKPHSSYDHLKGGFQPAEWKAPVCKSIKLDDWTVTEKYINYNSTIQSKQEIASLVKALNPYAQSWLMLNGYDYCKYLMAPYLETLVKAGYVFAKKYLEYGQSWTPEYYNAPLRFDQAGLNGLNHLCCKKGTDPKSILNMSSVLCKALKDIRDITYWDEFRRLDKKVTDPFAVKRLFDIGLDKNDVKLTCEILKKEYNGKRIFTADKLQRYLTRVDTCEAIEMKEALPLIRDYIVCCLNIGKKPIFTGDSLKREHDVTVRMNRTYRNEKCSEGIKYVGSRLKKYEYKEANFLIRPIESYEDLIDEGTQQGNCLAAVYPEMIATETRYVFVMRSTKEPDKSLATVEVWRQSGGFGLGQHLLSHNREMTNQAQLKFLKRWLKHVEDIFAASAAA